MKRWDRITDKLKPIGDFVGAEIGVECGFMSRHLLELNPNLTLYMIDRWNGDKGEKNKDKAEENVEFAGVRARIYKTDALFFANTMENLSLDFAFLDIDHSGDDYYMDLKVWWPKIKRGGFLCGHDFKPRKEVTGVAEAVKRFFPDRKIDLYDKGFWAVTK